MGGIRFNKIFKTFLKVSVMMAIAIAAIALILFLALQLKVTQQYLTQKTATFLSDKTTTKVTIGEIQVAFPKTLVVNRIYIGDAHQDTLLYSQSIGVNLNFWDLLSKNIAISDLKIDSAVLQVNRAEKDSLFNYVPVMAGFASKNSEDTAQANSWAFSIANIELNEVRVTYFDQPVGMDLSLRLGHLDLEMRPFDFQSTKLKAKKLEVQRSKLVITQGTSVISPKDPVPLGEWHIALDQLLLSAIKVQYNNLEQKQVMDLQLGAFDLTQPELNLASQSILIEDLGLQNSSFSLTQSPDTVLVSKLKKAAAPTATPWRIRVNAVKLDHNRFAYDNFNSAPMAEGMDLQHLLVSDIGGELKELYYQDKLSVTISDLNFQERNGFQMDALSAILAWSPQEIQLKDLSLHTSESSLQNLQALVTYKTLDQIATDPQSFHMNFSLDPSTLGLKDAVYFRPQLKSFPVFAQTKIDALKLAGGVEGTLANFVVKKLDLEAGQDTRLQASGRIEGLPDWNKTTADLKIGDLATSATELQLILGDSTGIPFSRFPSHAAVKGGLKGSMKEFTTQMELFTSSGDAQLDLGLKETDGLTSYSGTIKMNNLDLAALSGLPALGHSTNVVTAFNGSGLKKEDMMVKFQTQLENLEFKAYTYTPFQVTGDYKAERLDLMAAIADKNLQFELKGQLDLNSPKVAMLFVGDLKTASLKALHLTNDSIVAKGSIKGNMKGLDAQDFNGSYQLTHTAIFQGGKNYQIDSLDLEVTSQPNKTEIKLFSNFLTADFKSNFDLTVLPTEVKRHVSNYFKYDSISYHSLARNFDLEMNIIEPQILVDLVSADLHELGKGYIKGSYQSQGNQLKAEVDLLLLRYKGIRMDSLIGNITSNENSLSYSFSLSQLVTSKFDVTNPVVHGIVKNDSIKNELLIKDTQGKVKYLIGGNLTLTDHVYRFHLLPDQVVLNYNQWAVPDDNYVTFSKGKLWANHLEISRNGQGVAINSLAPTAKDQGIKIDFNQFELSELSSAVSESKELVSGTVNGSLLFTELPTSMAFTTNLTIDRFTYEGGQIGDVKLQVKNNQNAIYDLTWSVTGTGDNANQVQGKGYMTTGSGSTDNQLNMDVTIMRINLASIEGLLQGEFSNLSGGLSGDISLRGALNQPSVNGVILFDQSRFKMKRLNAFYQLTKEKVEVDGQGIHFNQVQLQDSAGNPAAIDGVILTNNFKEYQFDLKVKTKNFTVLNTPANLDSLYYGHLIVDAEMQIKGDQRLPLIDAKVVVDKGSEFTLVIPVDSNDPTGADKIVEFADMEAPAPLNQISDTVGVQSNIKGVSFNANIVVDQETKINVIVDPAAGDHLEIRGKGNLGFAFDPSGKISMSGRYEAEEGFYQLTFYNFIRRKFNISKGSAVVWSGDPVNAAVDINATYTVKTQPYDLVRTSLSETESQSYRRPLPFEVHLRLTGQLLQPALDFSIALPPDEGGAQSSLINTRLAQINQEPAERNKQVFALLLLSRFISDTPGAISQTDLVTSNVLSSVSQLVSQQLNALAGQYIKGISLNFDLQTYGDYSSGQNQIRTSLQLELSKQFFDDRLIVTVGSNLDLNSNTQEGASGIPGDFSVEYLLTPDGRYRLKGFSNTAYEGVIDGQLTTTGIAFIFTRDYNKLYELFNKQRTDTQPTN